MQVAIFWSESIEDLETEINLWFEKNKFEIFDVKYGHSEGCNSAMVIYKT